MVDVLDIVYLKKLKSLLERFRPQLKIRVEAPQATSYTFLRPSQPLYGILLYFFNGVLRPRVPAGRHVWTVELDRELYRDFYCVSSGEYYRSDTIIVAKLDISYLTKNYATVASSMHLLPHQVNLQRVTGDEAPIRPEQAIRNFYEFLCRVYYQSLTHFTYKTSPESLLILTLVATLYRELSQRVVEMLNLARMRKVKTVEGSLDLLFRKFRECNCITTKRYCLLDLNLIAGLTVRAEDKFIEETQREIFPNMIFIRDLEPIKAAYVNWSDRGVVLEQYPDFLTILRTATTSIMTILFLDILIPQTIAMVYVTVLY